MSEIREVSADETGRAYEAMLELRPSLGSQSEFVEQVNGLQRPEGYRLVACFVDGHEQAVAVAGFRVVHSLVWGFALYCDDLSTRAAFRRRGYAGAILDWLIDEARRLGCDQFHLRFWSPGGAAGRPPSVLQQGNAHLRLPFRERRKAATWLY